MLPTYDYRTTMFVNYAQKFREDELMAIRLLCFILHGIQTLKIFSYFSSVLYCCCCKVTSVVSDSLRPQRQQPTRLPRPWDSPGKNMEWDAILLQCMKVKSESEVARSCLTLSDPMDCSLPGSSVHGISQARVPEWAAIAFSMSYTAAAKSLQLYLTLCDPIDGSPPGSPVHGIL